MATRCNVPSGIHRGDSENKRLCPLHGDGTTRTTSAGALATSPPPSTVRPAPVEPSKTPVRVDSGWRPHPLLMDVVDHGYDMDNEGWHRRRATYITPSGQRYLFTQRYRAGSESDEDGDYPIEFECDIESEGDPLPESSTMNRFGDDLGYQISSLAEYSSSRDEADMIARRTAERDVEGGTDFYTGDLSETFRNADAFNDEIWAREAEGFGVSSDGFDMFMSHFDEEDGFAEDGIAITSAIFQSPER